MAQIGFEGVQYALIDTDTDVLAGSSPSSDDPMGAYLLTLPLASEQTERRGARGNPELGERIAAINATGLRAALAGADLVVLVVGLGGGTGTGVAPVLAAHARDLGALTIATVAMPLPFEGRARHRVAMGGLAKLTSCVDAVLALPNERLPGVIGPDVTMQGVFGTANDLLRRAVEGVVGLIARPGLINVDIHDVRTIFQHTGPAMFGTGTARGPERAMAAAEAALRDPLIEDGAIRRASGVLVNVSAGYDLTMREFDEIGRVIAEYADDDAIVVMGTVLDPNLQDAVRVTVLWAGVHQARAARHAASRSDAQRLDWRPLRALRVVRGGATGQVVHELE